MKKLVLKILFVSMSLFIPINTSANSCKPLMVFYSGFGSEVKENLLWELCQNYEKSGVAKRCLTWTDDKIDFIINHWKSTKEQTPIILIGHSWGGDTAYDIADRLPRNMLPTLITLDAVGTKSWVTIGIPFIIGFAYRNDNLKKPTQGEWLNLHVNAGDWSIFIGGSIQLKGEGSCNSIARAGGIWGEQRNATSKFFDGDHCDVKEMFYEAEATIENAMECLNR